MGWVVGFSCSPFEAIVDLSLHGIFCLRELSWLSFPHQAAAAAAGFSNAGPNSAESNGDAGAAANAETGLVDEAGDGGASAAPPQSIASQLDALAVQEDLLLQQYQVDMRHLDEARPWTGRGGEERFS